MRRFLSAALLLLLPLAAAAQVSQQPFFNVIALDASATAEVPADTLTITLFTEEQGPEPSELAVKVNARLDQAIGRAKADPAVEVRSGAYQTFPVYDRASQITGWRIRAELVLSSKDFKAVSGLAGKLQPALKISAMTFSLSRAAREKAEASLLAEAIARYQTKAQAIAKGFGFPGFTLGVINVHTEGAPPPQPIMYRAASNAAMADSAPPPIPAEGGKNAVTVAVSGNVILGPGK